MDAALPPKCTMITINTFCRDYKKNGFDVIQTILYLKLLANLEQEARQNKKGLWVDLTYLSL
jgi:hypothetical protein